MKKYIWFLPFLVSCGLFKKNRPTPPATNLVFESQKMPEIRKALALDYSVRENGEEMDLSLYPLNDSGYNCDYMFAGNKGIFYSNRYTQLNSNQYFTEFGFDNSQNANQLAMWMSQSNFRELQSSGKTKVILDCDSAVTFEFKGLANYNVTLADSTYNLKVCEIAAIDKPFYISFLIDIDYPLIVKLNAKRNISLFNITNSVSPFSNFEPAQGCILEYRIIEAGVNEYEVKLRNTLWSDSLLKFKMSGTYTSESYSYEFGYDVVFLGNAMRSPNFLVPIFSAIKGEKIEDENNWIVLQKNEINLVETKGSGYLSIPTDIEDPREYPDDYEDTASFNAALRDFESSYHTRFELDKLGRIRLTDYMYYDRDWQDNQLLGVSRLLSPEKDMEIMVLNKGSFPLMVYYDDGQMYEIFLEAAGKDEE